jgi:hypothetical protein
MRTLLIAPLMLLATLCVAIAAPFSHHQERHPNAAEVVPLGWRLQPNDPSWRGNRFVSPDGSSWFAAYSSPVASEPAAAHMNRITSQDGEAITYIRREPDWLAVSGLKGNRIFYRKAVIACGGKIWHHIAFEYPAFASDKWTRLSSGHRGASITQNTTVAESLVRLRVVLNKF